MEILLFTLFLGQPVWMWLTFVLVVIVLLAFDLGVLNKTDHEIGVLDQIGKLGGLIAGVDWNRDCAGHDDPEQRLDKVRARGEQDADMVVRLHPKTD